ncbi:hypothetical protein QZH41_019005, partial [Actinostola sp. cb2023]
PLDSSEPVCLDDLERKAKQTLSEDALKYYAGGADEEVTLRDNVDAFKRFRLRPRMLRGISQVDLSTTVLGQTVSMPICVAPTGFHRLAHPDGELATARACDKSGTLMVLSIFSTTPIADIVNATPTALHWQQLYILKDKENVKTVIRQAEQSRFKALVITVDAPVMGNRRAISKPGFFQSLGLSPPLIREISHKMNLKPEQLFIKHINWDSISWIKSLTKLPVIVKGIMTAEDARLAVQHGVDAIIVSNHGGRQLDGVLAAIDALPEVISAVNGQIEVYMDGGVRLGTDVLKALALGARAVFIGRPVLWGLAYQVTYRTGDQGVHKVLELLRRELTTAMILSGCSSVADIPASLVTRRQCQCHF